MVPAYVERAQEIAPGLFDPDLRTLLRTVVTPWREASPITALTSGGPLDGVVVSRAQRFHQVLGVLRQWQVLMEALPLACMSAHVSRADFRRAAELARTDLLDRLQVLPAQDSFKMPVHELRGLGFMVAAALCDSESLLYAASEMAPHQVNELISEGATSTLSSTRRLAYEFFGTSVRLVSAEALLDAISARALGRRDDPALRELSGLLSDDALADIALMIELLRVPGRDSVPQVDPRSVPAGEPS